MRFWVFLLPLVAALGPTLRGGPVYGFRALVVVLMAVAISRLGVARPSQARSWFGVLAAIWIAVGLVWLMLPGPHGFTEMASVAGGICLVLVAGPVSTIDHPRATLMYGWLLAWLISAAIALFEVATGWHAGNYLPSYDGAERVVAMQLGLPAATFGNPNAFGAFLLMATPWLLYLRATPSRISRVAIWLALLTTPWLLVLANARLCLFAWVVAVFLVLGVGSGRRRRRWILVLGASAAVVVSLVLPLGQDLASETQDSSGQVRLSLSLAAGWVAWRSGGLGVGPGALEGYLSEHPAPFRTLGQLNAHDVWLEILAQYGVIVAVPLIIWLIVVARTPETSRERALVWSGLLALVVGGVADSSLLEAPIFWAQAFTLMVVVSTSATQSRTEVASPLEETRSHTNQISRSAAASRAPKAS